LRHVVFCFGGAFATDRQSKGTLSDATVVTVYVYDAESSWTCVPLGLRFRPQLDGGDTYHFHTNGDVLSMVVSTQVVPDDDKAAEATGPLGALSYACWNLLDGMEQFHVQYVEWHAKGACVPVDVDVSVSVWMWMWMWMWM